MRYDFLICLKRFAYYEQRFVGRKVGFLINDDIRGCGLNALAVIFWMVHKHQVAFFHFMNLVDAGGSAGLFADDLGVNQARNFGKLYRLVETHKKSLRKDSSRKRSCSMIVVRRPDEGMRF